MMTKLTPVTKAVFIASVLQLMSFSCGHDDIGRCALERSRLLEISHEALRENHDIRQQVSGLRGELVKEGEKFLALDREHAGLLWEYATAMEGQKELLTGMESFKEQHRSLHADYKNTLQEKEQMRSELEKELTESLQEREALLAESEGKYLRLYDEMTSIYRELTDLKQDHVNSLTEMKNMRDSYENTITVIENKFEDTLREKENIQEHFETLLAMAVGTKNNLISEAEEKYRAAVVSKSRIEDVLKQVEKDHAEAVAETKRTREYHERSVYVATLTIDRLKDELKDKCSKASEETAHTKHKPDATNERIVEDWHEWREEEHHGDHVLRVQEKKTEEREENSEKHSGKLRKILPDGVVEAEESKEDEENCFHGLQTEVKAAKDEMFDEVTENAKDKTFDVRKEDYWTDNETIATELKTDVAHSEEMKEFEQYYENIMQEWKADYESLQKKLLVMSEAMKRQANDSDEINSDKKKTHEDDTQGGASNRRVRITPLL